MGWPTTNAMRTNRIADMMSERLKALCQVGAAVASSSALRRGLRSRLVAVAGSAPRPPVDRAALGSAVLTSCAFSSSEPRAKSSGSGLVTCQFREPLLDHAVSPLEAGNRHVGGEQLERGPWHQPDDLRSCGSRRA